MNHSDDNIEVLERMYSWLKEQYNKQAPSKLKEDYIDITKL